MKREADVRSVLERRAPRNTVRYISLGSQNMACARSACDQTKATVAPIAYGTLVAVSAPIVGEKHTRIHLIDGASATLHPNRAVGTVARLIAEERTVVVIFRQILNHSLPCITCERS